MHGEYRQDFLALGLRLPFNRGTRQRRALLTDSESGKYGRMSGSRTTAPSYFSSKHHTGALDNIRWNKHYDEPWFLATDLDWG